MNQDNSNSSGNSQQEREQRKPAYEKPFDFKIPHQGLVKLKIYLIIVGIISVIMVAFALILTFVKLT